MKTLPTYSKSEIESLKISEITEINNSFAKALGIKTTKRFSTKPKAIARTLDHQAQYVEEFAKTPVKKTVKKTVKKSTKKASGYRKFGDGTLLALGSVPTKNGTAMSLLIKPIGQAPVTAKRIIDHFVKNYVQPRGFTSIDEKFARDYITGAIRKAHLVIKG